MEDTRPWAPLSAVMEDTHPQFPSKGYSRSVSEFGSVVVIDFHSITLPAMGFWMGNS